MTFRSAPTLRYTNEKINFYCSLNLHKNVKMMIIQLHLEGMFSFNQSSNKNKKKNQCKCISSTNSSFLRAQSLEEKPQKCEHSRHLQLRSSRWSVSHELSHEGGGDPGFIREKTVTVYLQLAAVVHYTVWKISLNGVD